MSEDTMAEDQSTVTADEVVAGGSSPESALEATTAKIVSKRSIPGLFFDLISSFGLTCVILVFLMVLTFKGTVAQQFVGNNRALDQFFYPMVAWLETPLGFAMPMPGAMLLLCVLFVNLICGGMVRIRRVSATAGIIVTHIGVLLLLVSGFVTYATSEKGHLTLQTGKTESVYYDFIDHEIAIGELIDGADGVREHLIPDSVIRNLGRCHGVDLPFTMEILSYLSNCEPRRVGAGAAAQAGVVDGAYLMPLKPEGPKSKRRNVPGAIVLVRVDGQPTQKGMLWALERYPWTFKVGNVDWTMTLRRRHYDLPFELRLDKFTVENHPGTSKPRLFKSDVTKIEDGAEQKYEIVMNRPMRHNGFTLSQNAHRGNTESTLEVTTNPADQWPKWCCWVIAVGLLMHFLRKLVLHMEKQKRMAT